MRLTLALLLFLAIGLPPMASSINLDAMKRSISNFLGHDKVKRMGCADCVQLAVIIDGLLYKPPDVESDDPNIAVAGPGRRMRVHHKEPEIMAALDGACGKLAESRELPVGMLEDCQRLMAEHRDAIENHIFDKGTDALASAMCVAGCRLCDPHHLVDGGEL